MIRYTLGRILTIIPTALGVVFLAFLLIHLVPGDPVEVLLGEHALASDRDALRMALGLDKSVPEQLVFFVQQLLHFDLGTSYYSHVPVTQMITERLPATMQLAGAAIFFALATALPLGLWAAIHQGKWQDKTALSYAMLAFSMPSFWIGPLLMIIFSLYFGVLPISGYEEPSSIVLPAVTLGLGMSAIIARLLRSSLLEAMGSDYMRTARAKGMNLHNAVYKHAFKNALLPVVTIIFLQAGALLTGAILTEAIFSWPGIGGLIVESLQKRDYPTIQGCMLFIAFVYMFMTFLSDLVYAFFDPRIRHQQSGGGG